MRVGSARKRTRIGDRWPLERAVLGGARDWTHELSPRHAELLYLLSAHRTGRTRAGLYHWIELERAGGGLGGDFGYTRLLADVRSVLQSEVEHALAPVARPLAIDPSRKPHVILVVGVNGTGKTTTIGKLAQTYREQGKRPVMVAGDTFRAAAVEQLTTRRLSWAVA